MAEYARMLDKRKKPTEELIARTLGTECAARMRTLESYLGRTYALTRELRFPFGNNYGWGYKYAHGRKHLCYLFFEEGAFTVTLQIGDDGAPAVEAALPGLLPQTQALWAKRYPCGDLGGWIHYRVLADAELPDLQTLIRIKVKPPKKTDA